MFLDNQYFLTITEKTNFEGFRFDQYKTIKCAWTIWNYEKFGINRLKIFCSTSDCCEIFSNTWQLQTKYTEVQKSLSVSLCFLPRNLSINTKYFWSELCHEVSLEKLIWFLLTLVFSQKSHWSISVETSNQFRRIQTIVFWNCRWGLEVKVSSFTWFDHEYQVLLIWKNCICNSNQYVMMWDQIDWSNNAKKSVWKNWTGSFRNQQPQVFCLTSDCCEIFFFHSNSWALQT